MKSFLTIVFLFCCSVFSIAQSKKFQQLGGSYEPGQVVQGLKAKGILVVPSFSSLPTYPITYGGDSTRGAIAYVVGDSSMHYWTGNGWLDFGTGSGAGVDTTNLSRRIDSLVTAITTGMVAGIKKVKAGYGLSEVNDSTLAADTSKIVSHTRHNNALALKLNVADTGSMLNRYLVVGYRKPGVDSFFFKTRAGNEFAIKDSVGLGSSTDTTIYAFVLDSTNNKNQRVMVSLNNKLWGFDGFLYDSLTRSVKIGFAGVPPTSDVYKLQVGGGGNFISSTSDQTRWSFDNTNYATVNVNNTGTAVFSASGSSPFIQFASPVRSAVTTNSIAFTSNTVPANSNFVSYATGGSQQTTSGLQLNGSNTFTRVHIRGSAGTIPATSNNYASFEVGQMVNGIPASGTNYIFANAAFKDLVINASTGSGVLQNAATHYIEKAPTGTGIPNNNYALFVDDGVTRLDGGVVAGADLPHASAIADFSSTSKGFLIPRLSTTQINAISSPATGLIVFNTDRNTLEWYIGSAWVSTGVWYNSSNQSFTSVGSGAGGTGTTSLVNKSIANGGGALAVLTSGRYNIATGFNALASLDNGGSNVANGRAAGKSLVSGSGNTIMGDSAGANIPANSTGATLFGYQAGRNGAGSQTAFGYQAGPVATGNGTFMGYQSGLNISTGTGNAGFGDQTLNGISTGFANLAFGSRSLWVGSSAAASSYNTALGANTLQIYTSSNVTAIYRNTAVGTYAAQTRLGDDNISVGYYANAAQYSGTPVPLNYAEANNKNISIGNGTNSHLSGDNNLAIGYWVNHNTGGSQQAFRGTKNTTLGYMAAQVDTSGDKQYTWGYDGINVHYINTAGTLYNFTGVRKLPTAGAALEIASKTGAFVPPILTAAEKALLTPSNGFIVFCSDCTATDGSTGVSQTYSSGAWKNHY
jgi:hypothetical protein